jgi:hypothetical protein
LLGIFPCIEIEVTIAEFTGIGFQGALKGRREVGKPKKYELREEKDKIAYFWPIAWAVAKYLCMQSISFVYGERVDA